MTTMTARGNDTAEAMEQIIRRLGADAYILSTKVRNGMVEVTASSEAPGMPSELSPPVHLTTPSGESLAQRAKSFADLLEARSDWAPAPKPQRAVPARNTPWARVSPKAMEAALLDRLEAELLAPDPLPVGQLMPRTVIVGQAGSGKSLLAVRMAAAAMRAVPGTLPSIIAPRISSLLSDDRLTGWSRLLGLKPLRPLIGDMFGADERDAADVMRPQIIDLSDIPSMTPDLAAALAQPMPTEIVLAIPAGLSTRRTLRECKSWSAVSARLCLTFCDQAGPDKAQLNAFVEAGLRLSRFAAGRGIVDTISVPDRTKLARWVQEEADETEYERAEAQG